MPSGPGSTLSPSLQPGSSLLTHGAQHDVAMQKKCLMLLACFTWNPFVTVGYRNNLRNHSVASMVRSENRDVCNCLYVDLCRLREIK